MKQTHGAEFTVHLSSPLPGIDCKAWSTAYFSKQHHTHFLEWETQIKQMHPHVTAARSPKQPYNTQRRRDPFSALLGMASLFFMFKKPSSEPNGCWSMPMKQEHDDRRCPFPSIAGPESTTLMPAQPDLLIISALVSKHNTRLIVLLLVTSQMCPGSLCYANFTSH